MRMIPKALASDPGSAVSGRRSGANACRLSVFSKANLNQSLFAVFPENFLPQLYSRFFRLKFQLKSFWAVSKKYPKRFDRKPDFGYTISIVIIVIGEWLNGRVAVSKTVGCVFESRLPCQKRLCLNYSSTQALFFDHFVFVKVFESLTVGAGV